MGLKNLAQNVRFLKVVDVQNVQKPNVRFVRNRTNGTKHPKTKRLVHSKQDKWDKTSEKQTKPFQTGFLSKNLAQKYNKYDVIGWIRFNLVFGRMGPNPSDTVLKPNCSTIKRLSIVQNLKAFRFRRSTVYHLF